MEVIRLTKSGDNYRVNRSERHIATFTSQDESIDNKYPIICYDFSRDGQPTTVGLVDSVDRIQDKEYEVARQFGERFAKNLSLEFIDETRQ